MTVLNRDELIELSQLTGAYKLEIEVPENEKSFAEWALEPYSADNPFQQCSIDLHAGAMYVPETSPNAKGGAGDPIKDEHVLQTGHTVLIRTSEKLTLPANVGGICFSPSRIALKAVLITNMGHVDPGYSGHLHFTAINMGREDFAFRKGDNICSMVFFKLTGDTPSYGEETFEKVFIAGRDVEVPGAVANHFPRLARDFVNVTERARKVAQDEIREAKWQVWTPLLIALFIAVATVVGGFIQSASKQDVRELEQQIKVLRESTNLEKRLSSLEAKIQQSNSTN